MFVPFLIMLREGLEAALIVSLIASYLKRTQRGRWMGVMWIGVLLAAALCLGLGIFINETTGEFPQKEQDHTRENPRKICLRGKKKERPLPGYSSSVRHSLPHIRRP